MKSKKAATARRTPPIGVDQDAPASCELRDDLNKAHQLRLRIAKGDRHRHDGYTRLATETRPSTLVTRAATGALGATSCSHWAARFVAMGPSKPTEA